MSSVTHISLTIFVSLTLLIHATSITAEESQLEQEQQQQVLEPLIVESTAPSAILDYDQPITVINNEQLLSKRRATIGDSLALEQGVSSSSHGPGAGRPIIRGQSGERVGVLRNGVGTGDLSAMSEDHLVTADPLQFQSVEVLRGPETLLYGHNAIGGTVNVVDQLIAEKNIGRPIGGEILLQGGNAGDNERTGAASLMGQQGALNWHTNAFYRETENLKIPGFAESRRLRELEHSEQAAHEDDHEHSENAEEHDIEQYGRLENSATLSKGAAVGASYIGKEGFFGISLNYLKSNYGVPGHEHAAEEDDHMHETDHEHEHDQHDEHDLHEHETQAFAAIEPNMHDEHAVGIEANEYRVDFKGAINSIASSIERVKASIGLFNYKHDELEGDSVASTYRNKGIDSRIEVLHEIGCNLSGVAGIQSKYNEFSSVGEENFVPSTDTAQAGIFSFHRYSISQVLDYDFAGRAEAVHHDVSIGNNKSFVPFSIATGPRWKINGTDEYLLGLSIAYAQRAPSPSELYADGAHLVRRIYEYGDESLGKESALGADLTFSKQNGMITGTQTSFVQKYSDYINLANTGLEDEGLPVYNYEATDAIFWGFESKATFAAHELLPTANQKYFIDLQFDYVRARDQDNSENIARVQPIRTITRLRNENKFFNTSIEGVFVEPQDRIAEFELATSGYYLLNTHIEVPIVKNEQLVSIFLSGTNLTDQEARMHTSFLKDQAPQRGRAVLVGLRGRF